MQTVSHKQIKGHWEKIVFKQARTLIEKRKAEIKAGAELLPAFDDPSDYKELRDMIAVTDKDLAKSHVINLCMDRCDMTEDQLIKSIRFIKQKQKKEMT